MFFGDCFGEAEDARVVYRQCSLVRHDGTTTYRRTSWLPEPVGLAEGEEVRLKDAKGEWSPFWTIEHVGQLQQTGDQLRCLREQDLRAAGWGRTFFPCWDRQGPGLEY